MGGPGLRGDAARGRREALLRQDRRARAYARASLHGRDDQGGEDGKGPPAQDTCPPEGQGARVRREGIFCRPAGRRVRREGDAVPCPEADYQLLPRGNARKAGADGGAHTGRRGGVHETARKVRRAARKEGGPRRGRQDDNDRGRAQEKRPDSNGCQPEEPACHADRGGPRRGGPARDPVQPDDFQAGPPAMIIHSLDIDEVYRTLLSSPEGLTGQEAARRLSEYGPNEIRAARKKPLYLRFVAQFTHFLAVLLWIAAAMCVLSELIRPGEGMLLLAAAIVGVIFINAVFTFVQEYRAEKAVEALKKLLPFKVKALRGGAPAEILSEEVVPGDVFTIEEGDRVPADARVIESDRLMVSNAPLTGESDALYRGPEPFPGEYLESPNLVFAGTLVVAGNGKAAAYATGMSTE